MTVIQTPILRDANQEKNAYRGFAMGQMRILIDYMKIAGLNVYSRVVQLDNGVVITCQKCFNREDVFISLPLAPFTDVIVLEEFKPCGFLTHPRQGVVGTTLFPGTDSAMTPTYALAHTGKGFTLTDGEMVSDGFVGQPYPLIDDDDKTWLFSLINDEWDTSPKYAAGVWALRNSYIPGDVDRTVDLNYGNVDWKGSLESGNVLTYRGNPSRYWPVGQFINIPGLSNIDHAVEGVTESYQYMTVFRDKVYQYGSVLAVMPYLYHPIEVSAGGQSANHQNAQVLGAAFNSDGVLICIVKTCYNTYPKLKGTGVIVSTWQTWKDGLLHTEWLGDESGAREQAAALGLDLAEVPDPGRGYFFEVIMNVAGDIAGGWKRLLRVSTSASMPDCNFFFSEDGSKACSVMHGELHLIEINGETAIHRAEPLGGFTQEIATVKDMTQISNPGEVDPDGEGAIFGGMFRIGLEVGDWIGKTDTKNEYTATKSGTVITAADYKGNELVKMELKLTGDEKHTEEKSEGYKWGHTGLPTSSNGGVESNAESRIPVVGVTVDLFNSDGSFTGGYCLGAAGACDPVLNGPGTRVEGTNCWTMEDPTTPCDTYYDLNVTVSDKATGLYVTHTERYSLPPLPGLSVSIMGSAHDGAVQAGDVAVASGGVGDRTFSMSGGTIDPISGVVLTTTCGANGIGKITAVDSCQQNAITEFRLDDGYWYTIYSGYGTCMSAGSVWSYCAGFINACGAGPAVSGFAVNTDDGGIVVVDTLTQYEYRRTQQKVADCINWSTVTPCADASGYGLSNYGRSGTCIYIPNGGTTQTIYWNKIQLIKKEWRC